MFDIGLQEMLVIGVIALLVFGPSRLPELGRMFGRAMREFRRASDEFRSTVETNLRINEPDPDPTPAEAATATAEGVTATTAPLDRAAVAPTVDPAEDDVTAGPFPDEPYCARRGARLFHRSDCGWVRRIPHVDRVYLKRVADAKDQGFVECPVCEPWEFSS